jgi:2-aminoadipate transaminase
MENLIESKFSGNFKNIPKSFIREILAVADQRQMISFAGGLPNPTLFPKKELAESAHHVLTHQGESLLQYAGSQGYSLLCKWIAERYNTKYGLDINPANIVITNGSQQTADIVSKMLVDKGDGVIVESPTYLGAIQAMSGYQPQFLNVDLLEDGPDLEQIENHCWSHNPKFMYSIPNFQNPSGICYNLQKRIQLAEILKKYNLYLLEDDPYNEIRFEGEDLPPVYRFAPNNVFWTGSFSKMVAPGLRLGWVVLPDGVAPHFIKAKQSTDLHSNNLSQYMLYHYFTHNNIDEHLAKIRVAYKQQCDSMKEMIRKYLPGEVGMTSPQGGMFLWLTLPNMMSSEDLIGNCIEKGVAFVPGRSFFALGGGEQHIRMNFSNSNPETIEKGIKIMGEEISASIKKSYSFAV